MCIIENITDKMANLKITDHLNVDIDSDETQIDEEFEETQIIDNVSIESEENEIIEDVFLECEENKIIEDVSMVSEENDHNSELNLGYINFNLFLNNMFFRNTY